MEHVSKLNIVVRDLPYTVYPIPTTLDDRQTYYMYDDAFYEKLSLTLAELNFHHRMDNRKSKSFNDRMILCVYLTIIGCHDDIIKRLIGKHRTTLLHYRKRYNDSFVYDKMLYNEVSKGVINLITLIDNNAHTIRTISKDMYDDIHMEYIQHKRKSSISKELTVTSYINQFT